MATESDLPKPPKHLRPATKRWWTAVVEDYSLEPHHLRLLARAAEAWDRGEEAREAIKTYGLTYTDRFGAPRARPEVAMERDCRTGFARLIRELALDVDQPDAPRAPRTADYGNRR